MMLLLTKVARNRTVSPSVDAALVVIWVLAREAISDFPYSPGSELASEARADCKDPNCMKPTLEDPADAPKR